MNRQLLRSLISKLDRLAAPKDAQVQYLSELGVADLVDELALEFSDTYQPARHELHEISPEGAELCNALDQALGDKDLGWRFADLGGPEWSEIRGQASAAAAALRRGMVDGDE